MTTLHVLAVASEAYPLVKTGGLADVVGALPAALAAHDVQVRTLLPGYPAVLAAIGAAPVVHAYADCFGGAASLRFARVGDLDLAVLDAPHLYARGGGPYADANGRAFGDNALRFAALARAAADLGRGVVGPAAPDIVHAHDWQAALAPAYLHYDGGVRPGTVMTVHNLAFQGRFPGVTLDRLHLPRQAWAIDGVEYHGAIGYLKAGLALADRITTVSPTYAAEIRTPEGGMGLDGLLRHRAQDVRGILNGIDDAVWNPATDPRIPSRFRATQRAGRARNRVALRARMGLAPRVDAPLFGVVSRFSWQKGLDLVLEALPALLRGGGQLAILGSGEAPLEAAFAAAAHAHAGEVAVHLGYDEDLAHLMQAGADAILVPSRFEPCGLTQLCALRYGALPVVARVGGLADTVIDANHAALAAGVATGFQFAPVTLAEFTRTLDRVLALWADRPRWRRMQARAMASDVGWQHAAASYAGLYRELVRR
ncbi:MAG: glycogen synthase GlgA [Burkholderiales bacterium]|nr:glycogen synthase GlgA [Burkholderiales bacterium]